MAEKETQKWYSSNFFGSIGNGIGIGAVVLSISFGIKGCYGPTLNNVKIEKARAGYVFQERDLNGNGQNEEFYTISGQKYFSIIDGKNIEDSLR